jgi:predicted aldo/keto reductase-like oxidoreductase
MLGKPHAWDSAQMPNNVLDAHFRSFQKDVMPVCLTKKTAVIGMKGLAGGMPVGRIPTQLGLTVEECFRYCLSQPVTTQVVGITSMAQLEQDLAIARSFKPMTAAEKSALESRVKDEAGDGRHELFKSSKMYDGPHHRKQHGFEIGD